MLTAVVPAAAAVREGKSGLFATPTTTSDTELPPVQDAFPPPAPPPSPSRFHLPPGNATTTTTTTTATPECISTMSSSSSNSSDCDYESADSGTPVSPPQLPC